MGRRGILNVFLVVAYLSAVLKAADVGGSCETQCGDGCCPHENGVCCEGDFKCCRQGQTCLTDTCIGLNVTLHSEKAATVAGFHCPNGMTPCEDFCCPYSDAVCCGDGTCCPEGFECTPEACVWKGVPNRSLKKGLASKDPENTKMGRKLIKFGIKMCPDKLHLCPISAECCRKDDGQWGCCPKVSN